MKYFKLKIRHGEPSEILKKSGYFKHRGGKGYIRPLKNKERFHVVEDMDFLFIHLDETVNGYHRMSRNQKRVLAEISRIKDFSQTENPQKLFRMSRFAPNLREIQKINYNA